jgi:hypothetical protein
MIEQKIEGCVIENNFLLVLTGELLKLGHNLRHGGPVMVFLHPHALYEVYNLRTPLPTQS